MSIIDKLLGIGNTAHKVEKTLLQVPQAAISSVHNQQASQAGNPPKQPVPQPKQTPLPTMNLNGTLNGLHRNDAAVSNTLTGPMYYQEPTTPQFNGGAYFGAYNPTSTMRAIPYATNNLPQLMAKLPRVDIYGNQVQ